MSLCGIIPAAGRGTRLGFDKPKLLTPVTDSLTIWDVLKKRLFDFCDHVVVVMSPEGAPLLQDIIKGDPDRARLSIEVQEKPIGMGDAVMKGRKIWQKFNDLCVIWGDQVHVSKDTLERGIRAHKAASAPALTIPLTGLESPYVEYCFDTHGRLSRILMKREGDICTRGGLGDVGTFLLSVKGLEEAWQAFEKDAPRGNITGEINFLPFLVYLSQNKWHTSQINVPDADEAKGINTPEELDYFRRLYKS